MFLSKNVLCRPYLLQLNKSHKPTMQERIHLPVRLETTSRIISTCSRNEPHFSHGSSALKMYHEIYRIPTFFPSRNSLTFPVFLIMKYTVTQTAVRGRTSKYPVKRQQYVIRMWVQNTWFRQIYLLFTPMFSLGFAFNQIFARVVQLSHGVLMPLRRCVQLGPQLLDFQVFFLQLRLKVLD